MTDNSELNQKTGSIPTVTRSTTFYGSRTDVGLMRDHNEDDLLVSPPLFVVADGMGGHEAGEVASELAIRSLDEYAPRITDADAMIRAVQAANLNIIKAPRQGVGHEGMGCTLTAAVLNGERLLLAQVGDSRAYLLHNGRLQQLTRDHSLMQDMIESGQITPEEARVHPNRSVITRAMGSDPYMEPDIYELNLTAGDRLLLCSDGLNSMIEDYEIEEILRDVQDPQTCADMLVTAARTAGGYDNITTIVINVQGSRMSHQRKVTRKNRTWMGIVAAAVVAVFALAAFGCYQYVNNSAYLAEENGMVAVYRGIPDSFLGIELSTLDHVTDVSIADLKSIQAGVATRIQNNLAVDGIDDANAKVATYQQEIAESKAKASTATTTATTTQTTSSGDPS